jgi:hypothetical protein
MLALPALFLPLLVMQVVPSDVSVEPREYLEPDCNKAELSGYSIHGQEFEIQTEAFGEATVVPRYGGIGLFFFLVKDEKAVYRFPPYWGNRWHYRDLIAIGFRDVNGDGRKDVLIISEAYRGHDDKPKNRSYPADVYFQTKTGFTNCLDISKDLEAHGGAFGTIGELAAYVKKKHGRKPICPQRSCAGRW